ncbi:MAG TPA: hypothetical protein VLH83_02130 [Chthoniobacterales bacterium]|nr:hypothetical protein [Chthoniobacterales bacterium]
MEMLPAGKGKNWAVKFAAAAAFFFDLVFPLRLIREGLAGFFAGLTFRPWVLTLVFVRMDGDFFAGMGLLLSG